MKKGYKRLLAFEIALIIIFLINSFVLDILSKYKMIVFLLILTLIFWKRFGIEKDRHRYVKDILLEVLIYLFIFFILYYLFGLIIGFTKPGNYFTLNGLIDYLIPNILYVLLREFLRYVITCKAQGSKLCIIMSILTFIFLDITEAIRVSSFNTKLDVLNFFGLTLLPTISLNIVLTYITYKVGYKPAMLYSIIIRLYRYVIPIIPNPSPYLYSVLMLILPIILCFRIYKFFKLAQDEELKRDYRKKKLNGLLVMLIPTVILVYFVSGYFRYHAIVIASGSMTPNIYKGDVVIIDKETIDYSKLEIGTVLAFRKNNILVVHRLVDKYLINDQYILYTKGDANEEIDSFTVLESEVYGVVKSKIPYIGLPTVWFNSL